MARVKILGRPGALNRFAYVVDAPVGRGGVNRVEDVLLVQFFLAALWGTTYDGRTFGSGAAPRVDGISGPRTVDAIRAFQKFYWGPTGAKDADGRVDVMPPNTFVGPRHGNWYTIIGLNSNYGAVYGIDRHSNVGQEAGFPKQLRDQLFIDN